MAPSAATATAPLPLFRDELIERGLLIATGVPGVYGRSGEFEDTLMRIDRIIDGLGAPDEPEVVRFPPVLDRQTFERSGFLDSFPHLIGTVHSFAGRDREHRELLRAVENGAQWSAQFPPTTVVLTPAACYPTYPMMTGPLPRAGRLVDVLSYCFRHEPSEDAGRMQMFRMHEYVRAGSAATVLSWRTRWLGRAKRLVDALGLAVRTDVASDPFFGRAGALLADSQRNQQLKLEILAPVANPASLTAVISLNYHQTHFAERFGIAAHDGTTGHTACVGFGLERLTLAVYRRHGLDRKQWSAPVREALEL
jgi:seryl-tRNA synthetase